MKRKAFIDIISYDTIEVTTPFKQKKFYLNDKVIGIDLIDLKEIPPNPITSKFFLVVEKRKFEVLGAAFGFDTHNIIQPVGIVGMGTEEVFPKNLSVSTVIVDDR